MENAAHGEGGTPVVTGTIHSAAREKFYLAIARDRIIIIVTILRRIAAVGNK